MVASDQGDDPVELAGRMTSWLRNHVVVVAERASTGWGRALKRQLCTIAKDSSDHGMLLVVIADQASPLEPGVAVSSLSSVGQPEQSQLVLDKLSRDDSRRWWEAVVADDGALASPVLARLENLDGWWQHVRSRPLRAAPVELALSPAANKLLSAACYAQQALSEEQLDALVSATARTELVQKGVLVADPGGLLHPAEALVGCLELSEPSVPLRKRLAKVLIAPENHDAWSAMRAAELLVEIDKPTLAQQRAFDALAQVGHALAREDLWVRWQKCLDQLRSVQRGGVTEAVEAEQAHLQRLLDGGALALELGDSDRAETLARDALQIDAGRFEVLLLQGRASNARGDLTTASLALLRALAAAGDDGARRASAAAVMAETRYNAGDFVDAARYAQEATEATAGKASTSTRLAARNVQGKLMLAEERWADAEQHFADDAYQAARHNLGEAELRAMLNRGVAVLSSGRRDEARRLYDTVLERGQKASNPRAVAYALSNLATIAILEHRYAIALQLSDRAIETRRSIGERFGLVRPISNLAELRLRLGLVDEAEQALRFGMQACGTALPLSSYAYFAQVAACIHLARGNTSEAAKELATAKSGAAGAGDRLLGAICERIGAQIALEDGDVEGARMALAGASAHSQSPGARARLALIEARIERAAGEDFMQQAQDALTQAQRADEPECTREALVLLVHAHRIAGQEAAARSCWQSALRERDRVAQALPLPLRTRYLARPELAGLDQLMAAPIDLSAGDPPAEKRRRADRQPLEQQQTPTGGRLVGESAPMRALRGTIARVAATNATVLVHGPTGTGKELVAEAIHQASPRRAGPLVKVNCAALVETLLLSELFGHEKGAFTGASARRRGRFEVAEGGTLFLDEIGDISPRTQVALLRVLQDSSYERVGGCTPLKANVRIVCATHRDLQAMVKQGSFREDLYYRLCGVVVEVPALSERLSDLRVLSEALLDKAAETCGLVAKPLSSAALRGLARHQWPGNVRELENAVRVAALFSKEEQIELDDFTRNVEGLRYLEEAAVSERASLPPCVGDDARSSLPPSSSTDMVYAEIRGGTRLADMKKKLEQECIARALVESGGNITRAAALLGMKRPRLSQLVKQYNLATVLEDIKS